MIFPFLITNSCSFINPIKHGQRHNANRYEVGLGRQAAKILSARIQKLILRRDKSLIEDKVSRSYETKTTLILFFFNSCLKRKTLSSFVL